MARTFIAMRWLLVALLGLGLWLTPEATYGQSRELLDAPNKSITLYGQGRYQDALPLGEKAVRLGEQELGANHQTNAVLRSYLAVLYQAKGATPRPSRSTNAPRRLQKRPSGRTTPASQPASPT